MNTPVESVELRLALQHYDKYSDKEEVVRRLASHLLKHLSSVGGNKITAKEIRRIIKEEIIRLSAKYPRAASIISTGHNIILSAVEFAEFSKVKKTT